MMMRNETSLKIPKKYRIMIESVQKDGDGWWIYLTDDYLAPSTDSHTIHEYNQKDTLAALRECHAVDYLDDGDLEDEDNIDPTYAAIEEIENRAREQVSKLRDLVSCGNRKIAKNTLIFNISSATDCPLRTTCKFGISGKCYALKAEKQYPAVLPYRRRQQAYWRTLTIGQITYDFVQLLEKRPNIRYVRINESGDVRGYQDLARLEYIAGALWFHHRVRVYTYTHNVEAYKRFKRFHEEPTLIVNLSMDEDNYDELKSIPGNKFHATKTPDKNRLVCPGSGCMDDCRMCAYPHGNTVQVAIH